MPSKFSTTTCLLTFALLSLLNVAKGNLKETESLQPITEFPVAVNVISNIGRPGVLLYNLKSENVIQMKYSVNCSSSDDVYSILATTSVSNIAAITNVSNFNIFCTEARFENSNELSDTNETQKDVPFYVGAVEGEVTLTVKTNMIGRSFLLFLARKINEDQTGNENVASSLPNQIISSFQTQNITGQISSRDTSSKFHEFQSSNGYEAPPIVVGKAMIIVVQLPRTIDKIFRIVLYVVIILATIGMGVKVDFDVIKKVMRRPVGPIIGICCQYICMPLIAFMVAKTVPQDSPAISFGIFACGIAPGGGPSNMFTYLLGGDLSLSVTMTTLSNVAALGLLPMWLFTLGDTFKDDTVSMHVPYEKILEALAVTVLPLFGGMLIKFKAPKISELISKILKPVLIVVVAFSLSLGVYANFYIFQMINSTTIFAGCLLPYVGYAVGSFVSFLCCRSWTHIKTIAIETGIQNTTVAFIILFMSLPPPDNQLASVAPASSLVMTPLPLFIAVFIYTIYNRCTRKQTVQDTKAPDTNLENGAIQNEKSQVSVEESSRKEDMALIILLWRKLHGTQQPTKHETNEMALAKELATMLPDKENIYSK